ncbi:unnamed protein product [Symbiodinium sp. CCMP2592]|nr:unnamed protein product [Symbiodinium sp. CCMP2592]
MCDHAKFSVDFRLALSGRLISSLQVDRRSTIRQVREELTQKAAGSSAPLCGTWSLLYGGKILAETAAVDQVLVDHALVDVVCSAQGRVVVTASNDCTARVFNLGTGDCLELRGHFGQVFACTVSANHCLLATASEDGTARVWAVHDGNPVQLLCLGHDGEVYSAVFSSCSSLVVTASQDGTACLWCSHTGRKHWRFPHAAEVYLATFSFDDQLVLTSSADGAACIVSVGTGELAARLEGHTGGVNRAEFSPVSSLVVTASSTTAHLWDGTTSTRLHDMIGDSELKFVNFSSDGKLVLATRASGSAEVWCVVTGELMWTCTHHSEPVYMAASCMHGANIALACEDGTATLWSRDGELLLTLADHEDAVTWISFSPWADMLVTASWDGTARLWSTDSGECLEIFEGHAAPVLYAEFSYLQN